LWMADESQISNRKNLKSLEIWDLGF